VNARLQSNANLLPNSKLSPATRAKYLLAGIELLQAARLDDRDRLLEQLKGG
jgi:hypothetical protein